MRQVDYAPHYLTGELFPIRGVFLGHHPFWPKDVFSSELYRAFTIYLWEDEHNEFHDYFRARCLNVHKKGAFKCMDCSREFPEYQQICGWSYKILAEDLCTLPNCRNECILKYICLQKQRQLVLIG